MGNCRGIGARRPVFIILMIKLACLIHFMIAQNQRGSKDCVRERPMDSTSTRGSAAAVTLSVLSGFPSSFMSVVKAKCLMRTEKFVRPHRAFNVVTNHTRLSVRLSRWDFTRTDHWSLLAVITSIVTMEEERR